MYSVLQVAVLIAIMATTSYLAGLLPLVVTLSSHQMTMASLFSMGILVSTALIVVIPEGIETVVDTAAGNEKSRTIGFLLLAGFLVMYLFDHIGGALASWTLLYTKVAPPHPSLPALPLRVLKSVFTSSITVGLLIHAMIDGISLGTSFTRMNNFQLIVFLSIIIHKIPTCFSLVTILIKEDYAVSLIKYHLLAFALASPLTCTFTYVALRLGSIDELVVGYLLLFSGGTFLYVVIHVMTHLFEERHNKDESLPPASQDSQFTIAEEGDDIESGPAAVGAARRSHGMSGPELLCSLVGMVVPIVIALVGEQ